MRVEPYIEEAKEAESLMVPEKYEYEYADFLGEAPYKKLYSFFGSPFVMNHEVIKMANNAAEVKFKGFKTQWRLYLEAKDQERKQYR